MQYRHPSSGETPLSRSEIDYGIAAGLIDLPLRPIIAIRCVRFQIGDIAVSGKGGASTKARVGKRMVAGYVAEHAY